jgi:hypothetical protein
MLKGSQRAGIAVGSVILSLPAFFAAFAGSVLVYVFAVLGGYNGTPLQAMLKSLSSWKGCVAILPFILIYTHIATFIYLLIRFARGRALPALAQLYCITIVLLAIGEKIRLQIVDGGSFFWFGAFSLPHVFCLFTIVWVNANSVRAANARTTADERRATTLT